MKLFPYIKWFWAPALLGFTFLACGGDSPSNVDEHTDETQMLSSSSDVNLPPFLSSSSVQSSNSINSSNSSIGSSSTPKEITDCPDDSQCHLFKENDISTWKFVVKDSLGHEIEYTSKIHYVEKNKWGQGDYYQLSWLYVIAPGDTGIEMKAQASSAEDILGIPNLFEGLVSSCEYKVASQPCRLPPDTTPDVNCYRTYLEIEPDDKLEIAECENGDMYLYNIEDVLFRGSIPENVERRFPLNDKHIGKNCQQAPSWCYDYRDESGNQKGGCYPTLYCPWKE